MKVDSTFSGLGAWAFLADLAAFVGSATPGLFRGIGDVEPVAAREAAPVVVALLHRRTHRSRGFTLWAGVIRAHL